MLTLLGCSNPALVSYQSIQKKSQTIIEPKVALWCYIGSKNDFHFIHHKDLGVDKYYKVNKSEFEPKNIFPLSTNQQKWQVLPLGVHAK